MNNLPRLSMLAACGFFAILCFGSLVAGIAAAQSTAAATTDPALTEPPSMQQQVVAAERAGLDALKANKIEEFADHTADEAILVDAHGPASKAQVVRNVADFHLTDYSMDDIRFVQLSPNSGLLVYTIAEKGVSHGKEFVARAYISSIWAERGGKWTCLFSQETGAR
jgi:hypothetical protein